MEAKKSATGSVNLQKGPQKTEKRHLLLWRRLALWFKTVFLRRKEYVPGDTFRFIWQKVPEVQNSFLYYRIIHMLGNLLCLIISFFHIFKVDPETTVLCEKHEIFCFGSARLQYEWLFYVTSIALVFNWVQSIWGLVLTVLEYLNQKNKDKDGGDSQVTIYNEPVSLKKIGEWPIVRSAEVSNDSSPKTGASSSSTAKKSKDVKNPDSSLSTKTTAMKEHRIFSETGFYWGIHSFSVCLSIVVDIVYWTLIYKYNPTLPSTYIISQVTDHGVNLPLMITDYWVVAFPILPSHICFTVVIPLIYIICNYLYFLAGGMNEKHTKRYLYTFLNWEKPAPTAAYGVGVSLALSIFLVIFLVIDHFKFKIRAKALLNSMQTV